MAGFLGDEGARGINALRSTIQGAVAAGMTLQQTLESLQSIYAQYGGRWTSQSAVAAGREYGNAVASNLKSRQLSSVRNDITIGSQWINYANLQRGLAEFSSNPSYSVKYHVTGNLDGAPIDRWKTATYNPGGYLPITVGALKDDLAASATDTETEDLTDAELSVTEISINAV